MRPLRLTRRWLPMIAGCFFVGVAGAIGPYLLLISPMEHVREGARESFQAETSWEMVTRFFIWFAIGLVLVLLNAALSTRTQRS